LQCIRTLIFSSTSQLVAVPPAELGALENPRKPRQKKSWKTEEEGEETEEDEEEEEEDEDPREEIYISHTTKRQTESTTKELEGFGRKTETSTTGAPESSGRKRKAPASTARHLNSKAAERAKKLRGARSNTQPTLPQMGFVPGPKRFVSILPHIFSPSILLVLSFILCAG
jgi:hypothetical protein